MEDLRRVEGVRRKSFQLDGSWHGYAKPTDIRSLVNQAISKNGLNTDYCSFGPKKYRIGGFAAIELISWL